MAGPENPNQNHQTKFAMTMTWTRRCLVYGHIKTVAGAVAKGARWAEGVPPVRSSVADDETLNQLKTIQP